MNVLTHISAVVELLVGLRDGAKCGEADLIAACRNSVPSVTVDGEPVVGRKNELLCEYCEY